MLSRVLGVKMAKEKLVLRLLGLSVMLLKQGILKRTSLESFAVESILG